MVERAIAWLTRGNRKVRYRGVVRNDHWLHHRAAALNLRRLLTLGLASHRYELGHRLITMKPNGLRDTPPSCHPHNGGVTSSVDLRV